MNVLAPLVGLVLAERLGRLRLGGVWLPDAEEHPRPTAVLHLTYSEEISDGHFRQHHEGDLWQAKADTVAAPCPAPATGRRLGRPAGTSTAPVSTPAGTPGARRPRASGRLPCRRRHGGRLAPILDKAVKDSGQNLAWKTSIVDLLKALKIDVASPPAKNWRMNSATPARPMTVQR